MANTREIRRRIRSVKNTAQITRAMQLVAASKMKRAQDAALAGRPYALLLAEILSALEGEGGFEEVRHPYLEKRPVNHRGILVIATDKGLCGALNANVFRVITKIKEAARFIAIGRKATQFLSRTRRELIADFSVSDRVGFGEVRLAVELMIKSFDEKEIDTIEIIYPKFVNALTQEPTLYPLLPLENLRQVLKSIYREAGEAEPPRDTREILFEPAADLILDQLLDLYIKREIYHMVLEAKASEHSARMVAMKSATDNANTLVDDLTLQYNRARQAAITQEILEIAAATMVS